MAGSRRARSAESGEGTGLTRRTVLRGVGGAVAATGGAAVLGTPGSAAVPPALGTDGRWIVDENGNRIKLRGVSTPSLTYYERSWHPRSPREVVRKATDEANGWYPNHVRLPIGQDGIDREGLDTVVSEILRPAVDALADRGVYALIDYHAIRPYNEEGIETAENEGFGPYDRSTDALVRAFWNAVAPEFATDDHVLFELFSEPTYPAYWADDRGVWAAWKAAAQPWVDLVKDHAPARPVVIGSPRWTSVPDAAPGNPFEGDDLIYAGHVYPTNGPPSEFDRTYGEPATEVPIFLTEFGWDPDGGSVDQGTVSNWGQPFRTWVEGTHENVGWTAWCFDDAWQPTMFSSPDGAQEPWTLKDGSEQMGGYVKQWLADTRSETVIGGGDGPDTSTATERPDTGGGTATPTPPDGTGGVPTVDGATPRDVDADGTYEDLNGNGRLDSDDVVRYFDHMDDPVLTDHTSYFDVNGNERIDHDDVVTLFEEI